VDTRRSSYSASSDLLETGPEPPIDYPLDNPSDLTQRSWISWLSSGALEV